MISKIPVPLNLVKSTLGLRDDIEIVKASISEDVIYLYTVAESDYAADFMKESENQPMQFSVRVSETS